MTFTQKPQLLNYSPLGLKLAFLMLICRFTVMADTLTLDVTPYLVSPKHYVVTKTTGNITVDGKANEKGWEKAIFTDSFVDIANEKMPKYDTRVKMLWDETYLYVYAQMEEPHIWGNLTERDTVIFFNNDFEVFIDPTGDTRNYGEIEINALGTVWDLFLDKPYRNGGKANNSWYLNALQSAVHIDGTLNNPRDTDRHWSVEMAIPLAPFIALKNKPKTVPTEEEQWRINFSRVQWDHDVIDGKYDRKKENGTYLPEYNWVWSAQGEVNMHAPEKWGYLQFTYATSAQEVIYRVPEDEQIKQVAYALFSRYRAGDLKNLKPELYKAQKFSVLYGEDDPLEAVLVKTLMGFEIGITSPKTQKNYVINETGTLMEVNNPVKSDPFVFATWAHGSEQMDEAVWTEKLAAYKQLGISEVLVGGSPEFLAELVPLAKTFDIKIHAWMWTLNRPNDTLANKHPDWYAINRAGKNSLEYRAYVDYYQWLSPFHPEAREYIKNNVRKLAAVEGLASIHLDYVRYVDVILGKDLQPKYNLVQDHEMPEYDYGYHPIARAGFKEIFGYDPMDLAHPELSTEWRQYRLNAITSLVNELVEIAHAKNQNMTAAVFPFPEMSRQMVRQAWNDWNLDAAYPMLYQNFYQENVNWIGFAARQGVNDVDFPIFAGLYSPALEDPADLEKAIRLAKASGTQGISIFTADNLTEAQKAVFIKLSEEWK